MPACRNKPKKVRVYIEETAGESARVETADSSIEHERPSLLEWQNQLLASPGYRAIALSARVKRIAYIFQANFAQYRSLVAKLQDPEFWLPISGPGNLDAHDDLLSEAERLLHNFLTSMSTRIDQERAFMRRNFSERPDLASEYRGKVAAIFSDDFAVVFLKDLRNHITHHQLPVAQSRETFKAGSISVTFILPCAPLLEWEWSSGVKEWIATHGDAIEIVDVLDAYARKAASLDKWLFHRIEQEHRTEIQEFQRAEEEYTRKYDRAFGL